ncbi:hypothetical protein L6R52_05770 [Myxococcota bacterium]|nr:hypothetical protein [Myxococcota bacterium]
MNSLDTNSNKGIISVHSNDRALSVDDFWSKKETSLILQPVVDFAKDRVRLKAEIPLDEVTLKVIFRLDSRDERVPGLYRSWDQPREVTLRWTDAAYYLEGLEGREMPMEPGRLLATLRDPAIRSICGHQKVVVPMTMTIEGIKYSGTMTIGPLFSSTPEEPVDSNAADYACEDHAIIVYNWCDDTCKFILPADPRVVGTCTLGGVVGGLTATGTALVGAGGAELGVLVTTTASCWNEFDGKCKLVNAWLGDYCVCAPENAPRLKCNPQPSVCAGTNGGSCTGPTWTCSPPAATDAGVQQPVPTDAGTVRTPVVVPN